MSRCRVPAVRRGRGRRHRSLRGRCPATTRRRSGWVIRALIHHQSSSRCIGLSVKRVVLLKDRFGHRAMRAKTPEPADTMRTSHCVEADSARGIHHAGPIRSGRPHGMPTAFDNRPKMSADSIGVPIPLLRSVKCDPTRARPMDGTPYGCSPRSRAASCMRGTATS
jgi:hypothetical protein